MLTIARALLGKVPRLVVLELDGGAKDVTEWFDQGHSEVELIAKLDGEERSKNQKRARWTACESERLKVNGQKTSISSTNCCH